MSQRKHGALLSYASIFINLLIGLIFTPFLVQKLGQTEYGLFSIVGSFAAYLVIMDMGLNDSIVRYVVKYRTLKDRQSEENFLALMSIIYVGISIVVASLGVLLYSKLPSIFQNTMNAGEIETLQLMFLILLVNATMTILLNPISATMVAYERFVLLRSLEIASRLLATIAIVFFLLEGYKAVSVVAVTTVVSLSILVYKIYYAFFRLKIRLKLQRISWEYVFEIIKYASPIFIVVIVEQIYWKLDNIIIGVMLGPVLVAVYAIGIMFHKYFMSFSTAISKVMLPDIVRRVESNATATELTDILIRISRIQAIILLLILSGLVLFGRDFIVLWVGQEYELAYFIILLTLVPYSLELMGNIRNIILQVKGLYWYRSIIILLVSIFNVGLTIYLVKQWGILGAAFSTGVGIILGYIAVNMIIKIKLNIDVARYLRELFSGILPIVLLMAVIGYLINLYADVSWSTLSLKITLFTVVYTALMWKFGMNISERKLIKSLVPKMFVNLS